jgi:hypothetical protein
MDKKAKAEAKRVRRMNRKQGNVEVNLPQTADDVEGVTPEESD